MYNTQANLREYFLQNIGQIVDAAELQSVSGGIADLARVIRELRDVEGYQILTHEERDDLLPGQYLLASARPLPAFDPAVPDALRVYVFGCTDLTCEMCGAEGGEFDEYDPARRLRLHVTPRRVLTPGSASAVNGLQVRCSLCTEGMVDSEAEAIAAGELLARLQGASGSEQLAALAWLMGRFPGRAKFFLGGLGRA